MQALSLLLNRKMDVVAHGCKNHSFWKNACTFIHIFLISFLLRDMLKLLLKYKFFQFRR